MTVGLPSAGHADSTALAAEATRLRRLLEAQPSCLLRVGINGLLLAVNEAALQLLGATALAEVLGRSLTDQIESDHRPRWIEFAQRVRTAGSGSFECDLVPISGDRRTVLLQATALLDHPDGVESMILTIRDTTASRRLERALEEAATSRQSLEETRTRLEQTRAEQQDLRTQIAKVQAEKQRLTESLAAHDSRRGHLEADRRAEVAKLQQLVEEQQLALIEKDREHRELLSSLRRELVEAIAEQTRLATLAADRAAEQQRLETDRAAMRAELEQALHEEREERARSKERNNHKLMEVESRWSAAVAEQARLAALLEERQRADAGRADARAELEQALHEEREERARSKERNNRKLMEVESRWSAAVAEQARLAALLEEHQRADAERTDTRAGLERALAETRSQLAETRSQAERQQADQDQALASLQTQLSIAADEQARLTSLLDERENDRRRRETEYVEARAHLERALAEARAQIERLGTEKNSALEELQAQLSTAGGERARLAALLDERDHERQGLEAAHTNVRARLERALAEAREQIARHRERQQEDVAELEVELSRAVAEQTRLAAMLAARDTERHRLEADHAGTLATLEQTHAEETAQARQQQERLRLDVQDLQSKYDRTLAERERLATLVERYDAERRRIDAELAAARAEIERLTREHEHALLIREDEQREVAANLQAELALSMAVQKRLETELAKSEANQKRLVAEYAADRAQAERALGDAIIKKNQILKVLADQRIEVQRVSENARALEPLAAAGRLAVGVGRELQELTTEIDARARFLLSLCALEASYRSELEALHAEAVRAASLARQFALADLRQPSIPFDDGQDTASGPANPKTSAEAV